MFASRRMADRRGGRSLEVRTGRHLLTVVLLLSLTSVLLATGAAPAFAEGPGPHEPEWHEPSYCPNREEQSARFEVEQARWEAYEHEPFPFLEGENGSWRARAQEIEEQFDALLWAGYFEPSFKARPGVDWSGCNLEGAGLGGLDLQGADLSDANLEGAWLRSTDLEDADLTSAKMAYDEIADSDLAGAELDGVSSGELEGEPASLPENWTIAGGLRKGNFGYEYVDRYLVGPGADLVGAYLYDAYLGTVDLDGADLVGADLHGAELERVDLDGAELAGAELQEVSSGGIVGTPASLPEHWSLADSYLVGPWADLEGAGLDGADLQGADITHADMSGASLDQADLANVDGEDVDLEDAELVGAELSGATLDRADLEDAALVGADLSDADLQAANLAQAYLTGADLTGASLAGADLEYVSSGGIVGQPSSLPEPWKLVEGYLIGPGAELDGAQLSAADLRGSDLEGADLEESDLREADLEGANLSDAYFGGANLTGANLAGVLASETEWHDAICPDGQSASRHVADSCLEPLAPESPTVETGAASSITSSSATLNGTVNPNGEEVTSCTIEYSTSSSLANPTSAPCGSPGAGTSPVPVSRSATGLMANTTYYFRVAAESAAGKGAGSTQSFTTLPNPPTVETLPASSITSSSATLAGTVNPNGGEVTSCSIEYSTSPSLTGASSLSCGSPGSGTSPVAVSVQPTGLAPSTVYYFRVAAARNAGGEGSPGAIRSFTTGSIVAPQKPPTVEAGSASQITHTSATLGGAVNPNGAEVTSCIIEYGTSLPASTSEPCTPTPGAGTTAVSVTAAAGSLAAGVNYEYRLVATNAAGTSTSATKSFTTIPIAPPEFGRCIAVATGHGKFSNAKCTSEGGKARYEWAPGVLKSSVTYSGGAVKLETANRKAVTCTAVTGQGSYSGYKALTGVALTFTGCQSSSGQCSSVGAPAGEVRSTTLAATLVWASQSAKELALAFAPAAGSSLLTMQCAATGVTVDGSVLVPVKADDVGASSALKFKASRGSQKLTEYEANPGSKAKDYLEASFGSGAPEKVGLTATITLTSEESLEISSTI